MWTFRVAVRFTEYPQAAKGRDRPDRRWARFRRMQPSVKLTRGIKQWRHPSNAKADPSSMTARILIVDDVPANTRLLEAKLSAEYYQVTSAKDGFEALRMALEWQPDLI